MGGKSCRQRRQRRDIKCVGDRRIQFKRSASDRKAKVFVYDNSGCGPKASPTLPPGKGGSEHLLITSYRKAVTDPSN